MNASVYVQSSDLIRMAEVRRMTGWEPKYIHKMRRAGVLRAWTPVKGGWPWYSRSQVVALTMPDHGKSQIANGREGKVAI